MRKEKRATNEHLIYILEKTNPEQRMIWLKRAFEFWKKIKRYHGETKKFKS